VHRARHVRRAVSIHAPVKDATQVAGVVGEVGRVSIHAPVKDATTVPPMGEYPGGFQSTRP